MSDIQKLTDAIIAFRDERDWKQFHQPKDMALSLVLEAAEVLEHFQWKNGDSLQTYLQTHTEDLADELSDVLFWVLAMSNDLGINIVEAFQKKLEKTKAKYPVEKWKGRSGKYNEL